MSKLFSPFFTGLFILSLILFAGCSSHRPKTDPALDKKAFSIGTRTKKLNQDILTSKGLGWATLDTPERSEKFKIAWAAQYPLKSRMTFMVSGLPVETITANGEIVTFLSHTGKHSIYTYHAKDPDMDQFVQVPVHMSEIILLLLGRFPVQAFDDAYFSPSHGKLETVTTKNADTFQSQHLRYDKARQLVEFTLNNSLGDKIYQLTILEYKTFGSKQIPSTIQIQDSFDRKLTLKIINFIVNPLVNESIFQLTEPG